MKVFISWSGPRSLELAEALKGWIRDVIQTAECFLSSEDIRAGQRWNSEINVWLAETDFGVLCVTPENIAAPWLNFEAGALAKKIGDESRVVPITLGFEPSRLDEPLKQFNGVEANKAGIKKFVQSLAEVSNSKVDIERTFERWWPDLEERINSIPDPKDGAALPKPPDPEDVMSEILGVVKGIAREQSRLSTSVSGGRAWGSATPLSAAVATVQAAQEVNTQDFLTRMAGKFAFEAGNLIGKVDQISISPDGTLVTATSTDGTRRTVQEHLLTFSDTPF